MQACSDYRNLLLDQLYGLLDDADADALRGHLASCPECRAAQLAATAQQQLFARAAQVYATVPEFQAPSASVEPPPAPVPEPTLPLPARPRRALRYWAAAAAAAAVLLAVWAWRQY